MKNIICFLFCVLLISACEEQMVIIEDFQLPNSDRVVLIEELTGVKCPNCPAGSSELSRLIELYEGKVIGVGIHGKFLCTPLDNSAYDFRNEFAEELEKNLSWLGKPAAVINRIQFDDQDFEGIDVPALWQGYVEAEFEKVVEADLVLEKTYDPATRELEVRVRAVGRVDINEDLNVSVLLTESHIIDAQLDQTVNIPDYEHNHVMRTMLTSASGNALAPSLATGEIVTRTFSYTLPPEDGTWIADNMEVVAFIHSPTHVLQAAEAHVMD
jgi:hypothetical protein